jgi:hypothetical protein
LKYFPNLGASFAFSHSSAPAHIEFTDEQS